MTRSVLACLGVLLWVAQAPADEKAIDALAKDALERWGAPGVAVVVVSDDKVVHARGYGVRELGKKDAVTADTIFPLASLTKAFAATGVGLLVEDGKADWDDKVSKHLASFRLKDPLTDRDATLRDLLCHRSGLARHDLLWYRAAWPLDETVAHMAHLEPAHSFRAKYEYCNLGYIVAGRATAKAAGVSWDKFTRERLLEPLGMKSVVFTRKEALASADHATPHRVIEGKVRPIEWYPDDEQVRASGSLKASARDLAGWLRMNLNGGALGDKRILAAKTLREIHTPQVVMPVEPAMAKLAGSTQQSYALGWRVHDYRGKPVIEHGGAADGFRARIVLLPKQNAGFVLLTNLEENLMLMALGNLLIDELLGVEAKDWHATYLKQRDDAAATKALAAKTLLDSRKKDTKPSRDLSAYAGKYRDAAYGEVTIKATEKGLSLSWSSYQGALEHFHYDTFLLAEPSRVAGLARFELDRSGDVKTLHWMGRKFVR